jgi:hypothetical protein
LSIWLPAFLLAITYVLSVQMGHANPFYTSTFQYLSNDINKSSIHWVLTPTSILWKFGSPSKLQTPKVEAPLGVWGFILSHFPSLPGFLLARNLTSPCLGHEPKAKVATLPTSLLNPCNFMIIENKIVLTQLKVLQLN